MATPSTLATASPSITDPLGNGYANISSLAEALASRLDREHTITRDGVAVDHEGLLKAGSAVAFFSETKPASRLDGVAFADADRGLLWIQPVPSIVAMTHVRFHILTSIAAGGTFTPLETFNPIKVDTISERTTDNGVTIEGVNVKDNNVTGAANITASTKVTVGSTSMDGTRVACRALSLGTKPATPANGDLWIE